MSLPTTYNLLEEYPNEIYIETGIWRGDSLQLAYEARMNARKKKRKVFETIIGIDIDPECIDFCKNRFDLYRVPDLSLQVLEGNSAKMLAEVIAPINEPITFFLDSHAQLIEGEPEYETPFPLFAELLQIGRHAIKNELKHVIIIDDILHLTHPDVTGWSLQDIFTRLRWINHNYSWKLVANPVKNNVLIAY